MAVVSAGGDIQVTCRQEAEQPVVSLPRRDINITCNRSAGVVAVGDAVTEFCWATSTRLGDFTSWLNFRWANSLTEFAEAWAKKWSDFAERKSYVQKYGLSTYLDRSLVELWSK